MILFAYCIDPAHLAYDIYSYPHQAYMDGLIDNIESKDISKWEGVTLNAKKEVTAIHWECISVEAPRTAALEYLPPTVRKVIMLGSELNGQINTAVLPRCLKELDLSENEFDGSIDLSNLPDVMERLSVFGNQLSGALDLTKLPKTLKSLYLDTNAFTGTVSLTHLPSRMLVVSFGWNELSGSVDMTQLPAALQKLCICNNTFEGVTDFGFLPDTLVDLDVSGNAELSGEIVRNQLRTNYNANNSKVKII